MDRKLIVIVYGYGCHLTDRYKEYLRRVANFLGSNLVDWLIFCGGESQKKSAPGISEAGLMRDFLEGDGENDWHEAYVGKRPLPKIFTESTSLTTPENVCFTATFLTKFDPKNYQLVIFCDASQALKVKILAEEIFPEHEIQIETCDFSGRGEAKKQLKATILEVLALKLPVLARWHHNQRVKRAERI